LSLHSDLVCRLSLVHKNLSCTDYLKIEKG
jgi:hypothetical protein